MLEERRKCVLSKKTCKHGTSEGDATQSKDQTITTNEYKPQRQHIKILLNQPSNDARAPLPPDRSSHVLVYCSSILISQKGDTSATLDTDAYPEFAEHLMAPYNFSSSSPPGTEPGPRISLSQRTTPTRSTWRLCMPVCLRTRRRAWRRRWRHESWGQLLRIPVRDIRRVPLVRRWRSWLVRILHWVVACRIGHSGRILVGTVGRVA